MRAVSKKSNLELPPSRPLRHELATSFHDRLEGFESTEALRSNGDHQPEYGQVLLTSALKCGASDIHFESFTQGARIRFRIDGIVWDVAQLTAPQAKVILNQLKALAELDPIIRFTPKDARAVFKYPEGHIDLRIALAPGPVGETMSIRLLDPRRLDRSILELGLSKDNLNLIKSWMDSVSGMFLAAGPTGCGKTTTLYSLLHELKMSNRIIVTLEDPVEYRIDGITQIQIDMLHDLTFAEGAKSMLRLDPDFLMLGEIRDATSAETAVNAAISGRVLLSTVHSRDAVGAITALRNWDLPDHEIAESLSVIVAQRLVRKLCQSCRVKSKPTETERKWLKSLGQKTPATVWKAKGCSACRDLGYDGRTGVFELWRLTEEDYRAILDHVDEISIRESLAARGHRSVLDDAMDKVAAGLTSLDEVRRVAVGVFPTHKMNRRTKKKRS